MIDQTRIEGLLRALRALGFEVNPENLFFNLLDIEVPVERLIDEGLPMLIERLRDGELIVVPVLNYGPRHGKWKVCETHMVAVPAGSRRGCPLCAPAGDWAASTLGDR